MLKKQRAYRIFIDNKCRYIFNIFFCQTDKIFGKMLDNKFLRNHDHNQMFKS